ncbi:MAG: sugar phosphate isomerase/epimerase [Clostridia bacterium]|nr:sugar phosphate isomerase/epimerase [Clostridia bacterium]
MAYPVSTSIHLFGTDISLNEAITRHAKAGFRFLDFNFLDWQEEASSPFLSDAWEEWILSAKETADELGVCFNQAHAPVPCLRFGKDLDGLIAAIKRAIRACDLLGIRQMVYHAIPTPKSYGSDATWLDFNTRFFGAFIEDAKRYNVGICIENMWPTLKLFGGVQWNTDILLELVDSFRDDIVGVCWDTGHGNVTGNGHGNVVQNHPELLPYGDQYANITRIGKRLRALHIHDNSGVDDDHLMPGHGNIKWDDVIRALDDIGYEHSFTFEAHNAIRGVPEPLKDTAARLLHDVGVELVNRSKNGKVFNN